MEVKSGERLGGVGCGTVVSNNSDRSRVEKVRFASSAAKNQSQLSRSAKGHRIFTHFFGNAALREESFSWLSMVLQATHRHVVD